MTTSPKSPGAPGEPSRRQRLITIGTVLVALVAAVYGSGLGNDFVNFDDPVYISANPHVTAGLSWEGVRWAFTTMEAGFWQPLAWLSHMADCQLFGLRPGGHHFTSLLLHAISTVVLFLALQRMTGAPWRSALVAALFGVHPLHVETVAWASERKDLLSGLSWMLALLVYAAYVKAEGRMPKAESGTSLHASRFTFHVARLYLLCLVFFGCALMSKATTLTLPLILLLLDWWPLGRLSFGSLHLAITPSFQFPATPLPRLLLEKLPFLALAFVSAILSLRGQTEMGAVGSVGDFPIAHRIQNALLSYGHYVSQTVWPANLAFFYPYPSSFPLGIVFGTAVLGLGVTALALWAGGRRPWLAVGWFWFVVTLLPQIGLLQIGGHSRADRYTYLPLIGLLIIFAWSIGELKQERRLPSSPKSRDFAAAVSEVASSRRWVKALAHGEARRWLPVALAVSACAVSSACQVHFWRSSETLCRHALEATKDNYVAYGNLGLCLWQQGRAEEAIESYRKSLAIVPMFESADNLAIALVSRGDHAGAVPLEEMALQIRPDHLESRKRLALALARTGKLDEAIAQYRLVLQTSPGDTASRHDLGVALMRDGKLDEAMTEFQETLQADPTNALAHANLGHVLAAQNKSAEAIEHFRAALLGMPAGPVLRYELGLALLQQGKREEALEEFRKALRLKPDYTEARRQLEPPSSPAKP